MDNKKKKKYQKPEAEVTEFSSEDIITMSGDTVLTWGGAEEEDWA